MRTTAAATTEIMIKTLTDDISDQKVPHQVIVVGATEKLTETVMRMVLDRIREVELLSVERVSKNIWKILKPDGSDAICEIRFTTAVAAQAIISGSSKAASIYVDQLAEDRHPSLKLFLKSLAQTAPVQGENFLKTLKNAD